MLERRKCRSGSTGPDNDCESAQKACGKPAKETGGTGIQILRGINGESGKKRRFMTAPRDTVEACANRMHYTGGWLIQAKKKTMRCFKLFLELNCRSDRGEQRHYKRGNKTRN